MDSAQSQILSFDEVIRIGYHRAAASFTSLIGRQVKIDNSKTSLLKEQDKISENLKKINDLVAVKTSIIGALKGDSYLLLTREEEKEICKMSKKAFGGESISNDLVLKEIDNIISAAVITELSNTLDLRIFGDVPELFFFQDESQLNNTILSNHPEDDYFVMSNADFVFDGHLSICPIFLWRFEKKIFSLLNDKVIKTV